MPSTPIYGITYPCMSPVVAPSAFASLASTTELAIDATGFGTPLGTGEAYAVTHLATGRGLGSAPPLPGVEATLTFLIVPSSVASNGVVVNNATGTFTVGNNGLYMSSVAIGGNSATLTMTSQRVAVYVNGVLYAAKKTRGTNPTSTAAISSSFDFAVNLLAADVVTFRYLWTGTGVIGTASATVALSLISRT